MYNEGDLLTRAAAAFSLSLRLWKFRRREEAVEAADRVDAADAADAVESPLTDSEEMSLEGNAPLRVDMSIPSLERSARRREGEERSDHSA